MLGQETHEMNPIRKRGRDDIQRKRSLNEP